MLAKQGRWCVSDKGYVPTVAAQRYGRRVLLCMWCARPTLPKKPRAPKHQAADRRWSRNCRKGLTGERCEACRTNSWAWQCSGVSDAAHVVAKGPHPKLRHDARNRVPLCRLAHQHFTRHPAQWREWLHVHRPGLMETLQEASR